jgi:hypothetical protein
MSNELGRAEEEANFAVLLHGSDFAPFLERGDIRFRFQQNSKTIQALEGMRFCFYFKGVYVCRLNVCFSSIDFTKAIQFLNEKDIQLLAIEGDRERGISRHATIVQSSSSQDADDDDEDHKGSDENRSQSRKERQIDRVELNEILSDAHSKRAQCVLMLAHQSEEDLKIALNDATKASNLDPQNEEHLLVMATCNMRLERLADATAALNAAIKLNPENERALFHQAFCHRLDGRYRDAIENLTKVKSLYLLISGLIILCIFLCLLDNYFKRKAV